MKRLFYILSILPFALFAQSGIRQFHIVSDNSQFPSPSNVEWMQGESVQFVVTAKHGNYYVGFSNGASAVLKAWYGSVITQLYANKTGTVDAAASGKATVELLASEANFTPTGRYNYAVGVYDGTNYMGVIAQGVATIRGHPFGNNIGYVGTTSPFPYVPTNDSAYLGAITGAYVAGQSGTGSVAKSGRQLALTYPASGGGSGTFTNFQWGTNSSTAQGIVAAGSNNTLRSAGGTNYLDGTLFSTLYSLANGGGLSISQASGPIATLTVTNSTHLGGVPAAGYLTTNEHAAADSTTNYVRRTGGSYTATGGWEFVSGGLSNSMRLKAGDSVGVGGNLILAAGDGDVGGDVRFYSGLGDSGVGDFLFAPYNDENPFLLLSNTNGAIFYLTIYGNGSGLTDLNYLSITNPITIATQGAGTVVTNIVRGGSVITQQMGTVTGGASPNPRGFHRRGTEGSLDAVWSMELAPGTDLLAVYTATNLLTVGAYLTTVSTTTKTSIQHIAWSQGVTGAVPFVVIGSQPAVSDFVFSAMDYSGGVSVSITQTVTAAGTWYYTNLPLSITAYIGRIEGRVRSTNSVNQYQGGVDVRPSP